MGRIKDADETATKALARVDESASSQLRALRALASLAELCPKDGALARAVSKLRDEHAASFARFHLAKAERAVELRSPNARTVLTEAARFFDAVDASGGDAASIRARLAKIERGDVGDGEVRPFFARYLVEQRR
jgi:hypothetical protein